MKKLVANIEPDKHHEFKKFCLDINATMQDVLVHLVEKLLSDKELSEQIKTEFGEKSK